MSSPSRWLVVAALCAACGSPSAPTENVVQHAESAPATASCKPEPPLAIQLTSRGLGAGRYEVTATATPTKSVTGVELELVLPAGSSVDRPHRAAFGATPLNERRILVAIVETHDRSSEISAIARVPFEGVTMSRAATVTVGAPRVAPRTVQYTLPDGERAREVRP
ncbi:MAG: hypothetical protein H0V17_35660 [Deltaproteobacteria bacterium]|nr:hypothetical protein [Deltaproteobacteria bacterium]